MDKEHLSDAIGNIRDRYVNAADKSAKNGKRIINFFIGAAAAALAIAAVFALPKLLPSNSAPDITGRPETSQTAERDENYTDPADYTEQVTSENSPGAGHLPYAEINAEYPAFSNLITWRNESENDFNYDKNDACDYSVDFYTKLISEFLGDKASENAFFSPMSIFFSLSSLAEITDGETRNQILDLLDVKSVEELRELSKATWLYVYVNGKYYDDDYEKEQICIPANSFWLNSKAELTGDTKTAKILKDDHFTSFYKGDPGDSAFVDTFRNWVNNSTGGLLEEYAKNVKFSQNEIFKLVNTLLLEASWMLPFNEENSFSGVFHGKNGDESAEYMFREYNFSVNYYENDIFSAASLFTKTSAAVWLLLPKSGYSVESLIDNCAYKELINIMKNKDAHAFEPPEGYDMYSVQFTVPKFDITSNYNVKDKLINLGITNVFDPVKSEIPFLSMKDGSNICVTSAEQNVRVSINEQGVSAAAATIMSGGLGDPVFNYIDFVVDRPFMVLITSNGAPLFAGIINDM